jgi:hypothetical protein
VQHRLNLYHQTTQTMDFNFKTIHDFNDYFKDEETCYRFLESQRWNDVPVCPHCASAKAPYVVKARGKFQDIPSYRCSERGNQQLSNVDSAILDHWLRTQIKPD